MTPIEFKSSQATKTDGWIVISLFDGKPVPGAVAILVCDEEAAASLLKELGSVVRSADE
jgi:hypothetical protein